MLSSSPLQDFLALWQCTKCSLKNAKFLPLSLWSCFWCRDTKLGPAVLGDHIFSKQLGHVAVKDSKYHIHHMQNQTNQLSTMHINAKVY